MSEKCCEKVRIPGLGFYRSKQCGRNACVERDGEHYCLTHDPVRRKMKADKRYADYRAESDARMKAIARTSQCLEACKGMATPVTAVSTLKEFVVMCADSEDISPDLRQMAKVALAYAFPRSDEQKKSQSTEWPGSSNLC